MVKRARLKSVVVYILLLGSSFIYVKAWGYGRGLGAWLGARSWRRIHARIEAWLGYRCGHG